MKFLVLTLSTLVVVAGLVLYEADMPRDVVDARYSSPESQFADLGELGLVHYRDEGDRRSVPVVLLHGSNASLHTFEPWVALLEQQYRVITIDLPGHGLTGAIPAEDYSGRTMSRVVDEITGQLGISRFVLGGNSMGGGIAWRYALDNPEKIIALVLIDAGGARDLSKDDQSQSVLAFRLLRQPWFRKIAEVLDPYYLVAQGLKAAYGKPDLVTESLIMRYNDLTLREGSRTAMMQRFAQFSAAERATQSIEDLRNINAPTLLMWGRLDSVTPFVFAAEFESRIPDVTTAYYDDVGHLPMEEIPELSSVDLLAFLERVSVPPE